MGVGYTLGCLVSILWWGFDRQKVFGLVDKFLCKIFKLKAFRYAFYTCLMLFIIWIMVKFKSYEIANFITAFLVIDISRSEKENIESKEMKFHKTIAVVCKSLVCGFTAPLFYILIFGNYFALTYFILYNLCMLSDYEGFEIILKILTIIPGLILQFVLYLIYIFTSKKYSMDFKGDYLINCFKRPLLNIEIMAAHIESVGFYYHFYEEDTSYIKIYGHQKGSIDEKAVKHYLGVIYSAAFIMFLSFISIYVVSR